MKIKDMEIGQTGKVLRYIGDDRNYRHKLLRMGLVNGVKFQLLRKAPMGDPVEIVLAGFNLSLRKHEAEALEIEVVEE
jgi:ferrous iron transport protein A